MPRSKNKNRNHQGRHSKDNFVSSLRQVMSPAQRQTVTVPCRQVINVQFGQQSQDITFSRVAEQGITSQVYGYNSGSYFAAVKPNWEFFYVDSLTIEWCPSNLVGTYGSTTANFTQQSLGPFVFTDDPDTYSQNGDSLDARLQKPSFTMKPVLTPWKIRRDNRKLYGAGVLSPGDTGASNPMYSQITGNPLAAASLGLQIPGSGSTVIGTKFFAGMMVATWQVRLVSIKPASLTTSVPRPMPQTQEEFQAAWRASEEPPKPPPALPAPQQAADPRRSPQDGSGSALVSTDYAAWLASRPTE